MYSQEAIAQDGAPQGESAPADSADHDAGQNTAPVEVQDDVSLISIIGITVLVFIMHWY